MGSIDDDTISTSVPEASAGAARASRSLDPGLPRPRLPVSPTDGHLEDSGPAARLVGASPATADKARRILEEGTAENTRTAYRGDLAYFWAWAALDLELAEPVYPVSPAAVLKFTVDHLQGLDFRTDQLLVDRGAKAHPGPHRPATVARRLAALGTAHRLLGLENPCARPEVRALLAGARRRAAREGQGPRRKQAATLDILDALLATCGDDLRGLRDRALLLFGWATGGRRRSEIAAALVEDLETVEAGFLFRIRISKTDPEGLGLVVPVLGRAAAALAAWLAAAELAAGPLFPRLGRAGRPGGALTPKSVGAIVKRRAELAGLDREAFAGHSLRSGFITEGGRRGEALGDLMALSGHRAIAVALRYYQAGLPLRNPAGRLAG